MSASEEFYLSRAIQMFALLLLLLFLTADQHILGYLVPYYDMVNLHKKDIIKAI